MKDFRNTNAFRRRVKAPTLYLAIVRIQTVLHGLGISVHNFWADECTPDFNCCTKDIGRKPWLRIGSYDASFCGWQLIYFLAFLIGAGGAWIISLIMF